ncbi:hypothetical protein A2U01_0055256, partial [Trifolium medium]|nr:hypothetical protein [Trifolium medium]
MSTLYLSMKYPLDNGKVGTVKGDQVLARHCYEFSLKIRHKIQDHNVPLRIGVQERGINMISSTELDPREEFHDIRVSPIEELEQVQIREVTHQVTNLGSALNPSERERILSILKSNIDLFTWQPSDIPGIDDS